MPLWDWIPPYAEQITINQVQEKLNDFKQLVPEGFIELEQLNWMCSTQGWKEPSCERYNCLINGEWKQVDIRHAVLERLELTRNIIHPVYISFSVLNKGSDRYLAYNVEKEEEIFLQKPFTVEKIEEDINKLFERIGEQEEKNSQLTTQLKELQDAITQWRNQFATEKNRLEQELEQKNERIEELEAEIREKKKELEKELSWWDKWFEDKDSETNSINYFTNGNIKKWLEEKKYIKRSEVGFEFINEKGLFQKFVIGFNVGRSEATEFNYLVSGSKITKFYNPRPGKEIIKLIYQYYRDK